MTPATSITTSAATTAETQYKSKGPTQSVAKMVQTANFRGVQVPVPGFGAMGLSFGLGSDLSLEEAEPVLLKAIELGCTFWDTAVSREIQKSALRVLNLFFRSSTRLE